jgi:hypothetical protein
MNCTQQCEQGRTCKCANQDSEAWSEFTTSLIQAAALVSICAVGGLVAGLIVGVMK